jgi:hypothetical protein
MAMTFILSGNTSDFTTCHNSVILDPNTKYEAALLSLDTYNSIPNIIVEKNNIFKYSTDDGITWKIIAFNTGAYELTAINNEVKRQMIANGDNESVITITPNITTSTSIVNIENPAYKVDFSVQNSIGPILGFRAVVIGHGYNESPNIVDIMQVNSILVNIDIIMGSYVNGFPSPTIYSFYPNVAPGYKIVERPNPSLIYYPLSRPDISRMRVWLTDQNGNLVNLRGETITIRIYVRELKSRSNERTILEELSDIKKFLTINKQNLYKF